MDRFRFDMEVKFASDKTGVFSGYGAVFGNVDSYGDVIEKGAFKSPIEDFYLTNPIARASAVMAECSRLASGQMLTAAE